MKVLLISANTVVEPYPVYPLGLDYVAGAIAADHQVRILDLNQLADESSLEREIREYQPAAVGISLRNIDNTDALHPLGFMESYKKVVEIVRRATPAPVILGGSGFTIFPAETMRILQADFGVVGEGERMRPLLEALAKGEDPTTIEGVIGRDGAARIPAPWRAEIDRRFDPQRGYAEFYLKSGGMLNLQTKRGCPFRCVYCTYPHIEGRAMRLADPDEIARTAVELQRAGAKYLFITDSAFNADGHHSLAVARAFQQAGLTIPWGAFFAPTNLPRDYFETLADCGLRHVEFGTESLCDAVLTAYGKPFDTRQVFEAHRAALAAGLHTAHYFLLGGPGETSETLEETLTGAARLERAALFIFPGMRIYPHTKLYEIALSEGQIAADQDLTEPVYYRMPGIDTAEILRRIDTHAQGRINWVTPSGSEQAAKVVSRLHGRGHVGPLWEYLIR